MEDYIPVQGIKLGIAGASQAPSLRFCRRYFLPTTWKLMKKCQSTKEIDKTSSVQEQNKDRMKTQMRE